MHAYLLVGQGISNFQFAISNLSKKLNAKILDFPIIKVEDTRNLNSIIRLSFDEPTLVVCKKINEAGTEALNAFLKNLEEPQQNVYFALTAPSVRKVLPTIVSRCQIIRIKNQEAGSKNQEIENFMKMETGEKLNYIDKIKDRAKAIEFVEDVINFLHGTLHKNKAHEAWPIGGQMVKYYSRAGDLEAALKTLTGLKANGNVNLQLANMVIHQDIFSF